MNQQLRQHYERQDTEELFEMVKKDLTDEARGVLREVLASRGVSTEQVDALQKQGIAERVKAAEFDQTLGPRGRRLVAFLIDSLGVAMLLSISLYPLTIASPSFYSIIATLLLLFYFLLRDSIPGQSIGKRLMSLRVIQVESKKSCTWPKSLGRNISLLILFGLDVIFILGSRRMRLGDMLAETIVVRANAPAQQQSA
jgi:uncharacterized RDD family membrane protein YckC